MLAIAAAPLAAAAAFAPAPVNRLAAVVLAVGGVGLRRRLKVIAITDAQIRATASLAQTATFPDAVAEHAREQLTGLLDLQECRREYGTLVGHPPRLEPDGTVLAGHGRWDAGLPGEEPDDPLVQPHVERGPAGWVLVNLADHPDDLLIVGAGRRGTLARMAFPGVGRYCLAHARCPVLAIPPPPPARELGHSRLAWLFWHRPLTPEQVLRDQRRPAT